jgi:hypothetical protein
MLPQAWSLLSQLALPLANPNPMDVPEVLITDAQWAAGAALAAVLGLCFLFGSGRVRVMVLWVAAAIAPFTLWNIDNVAPRYVYLAAAPFAILVATLVQAVVERVHFRAVQLSFAAAATAGLLALSVFGYVQTQDRDGQWERATDDYRVLAHGLQAVREDVPSGSRIVVMDGPWLPYWYWPVATVRTIYRDPTLWAASVPPGWPIEALPDDIVVYHSDGRIYLTRVR